MGRGVRLPADLKPAEVISALERAGGKFTTDGRVRTGDLLIHSQQAHSANACEPATCERGDSRDNSNPDTSQANPDTSTLPDDPDLRLIIDGWADLPDAVRAGIVAMVRAATRAE